MEISDTHSLASAPTTPKSMTATTYYCQPVSVVRIISSAALASQSSCLTASVSRLSLSLSLSCYCSFLTARGGSFWRSIQTTVVVPFSAFHCWCFVLYGSVCTYGLFFLFLFFFFSPLVIYLWPIFSFSVSWLGILAMYLNVLFNLLVFCLSRQCLVYIMYFMLGFSPLFPSLSNLVSLCFLFYFVLSSPFLFFLVFSSIPSILSG